MTTSEADKDAALYKAGICPTCLGEVLHHLDEPFASCACSTREDGGGPGTIQSLRMTVADLQNRLQERTKAYEEKDARQYRRLVQLEHALKQIHNEVQRLGGAAP